MSKDFGKGYPLRHPVTGKVLPLPDHLTVCPRCGNEKVEKTAEGHRSPTGRPIFKCHDCRIELSENLGKEYCSRKGQITPHDCRECEILHMIMEAAMKTGGHIGTCPYFLGTMGEHFVPDGWQSDLGADDKWGKTRWEPKPLPKKKADEDDEDE